MTQNRRDDVALADDLPNYDDHSGKFMLRLIAAWIAMGLRRPEITMERQSARRADYLPRAQFRADTVMHEGEGGCVRIWTAGAIATPR